MVPITMVLIALLLALAPGAATYAPAGGPTSSRAPALSRSSRISAKEPASGEKPGFLQVPFFSAKVPEDQQPVFELRDLKSKPFYDWAADDEYTSRLFGLWRLIMLLISLPVAYTTYDQLPFELPQLLLSANIGTVAVMIPFVLRLRVGWAFVSTRLKEKASYYEAQQRGLLARKDRETRLRDRLLEKQEVSPVLNRIDVSLAALVLAFFLSVGGGEVITIIEGEAGPATLKTYSGDEALRLNNRLRFDDAFAKREQERASRKAEVDGTGVKPAYCDSRYYKILAGGNGQGGVGCAE